MKRIITYITIIVAITAAAAAAEVMFTVRADRTTVAAGGEVTVIARLSTPHRRKDVQWPQFPQNVKFNVTGRSFRQQHETRFEFGQGSLKRDYSVYEYIYTISPHGDGPFTFPALRVTIDGKRYETQPIQFNAGGQGDSNDAPAASDARSPDIIATLNISSDALYLGEQAVLTLNVAQRAGASVKIDRGYAAAAAQLENALGSAFSLGRISAYPITPVQERINGQAYHVYALRYAVFGLTAGEYAVPPVTFEYDEIRWSNRTDFFGRRLQETTARTTRTAPFKIIVKPLPPGAPSGFTGSVGQFDITTSIRPHTVRAGDAITLEITLRGNTRASYIGDPVLPELKDCDIFPPERQTAADTSASGINTRVTYRYLVIPKQEGELKLGPVTYPYFDPMEGVYKTLRFDPPSVAVTPGQRADAAGDETRGPARQEEIREIGRDIRYIKTPTRLRHQPARPHRALVWYLLFPIPFIIFLSTLLYKHLAKRGGRNAARNIRQKALANAVRHLCKNKKGGDDGEFLRKTAAVIEKYISNKFAFPATGRTLEELNEELLSRRIDAETVSGLTALIESINEHRFGGKTLDARGRDTLADEAIKFLSGIERAAQKYADAAPTPRTPSSHILTITLFTSIAITMLSPVSADASTTEGGDVNEWFRRASEHYAAGVYDSAAALYGRVADAGVESADAYYNLGNSFYRLGKLGAARMYYEKAAVINPSDPDIAANIRFIESVITDRTDAPSAAPDFWGAVFYRVHTLLPLRAQLAILFVLLLALSLLGSMMLVRRGLSRLWLAYGASLCALLVITVGASAGYKIYALETKRYVVILAPSADAMNQPRGTQTLFTAHEGTKLQVRKVMDGYSLVSLPNGASGWVANSALGEI